MMNKKIKITEDELPYTLQKFNNKDIHIYFKGEITGRITLHKIKAEVKNFEIHIFDFVTDDNLNFKLYDISNIHKTRDNKKLYLYCESIGEIEIKQ